MILYNFCIFIRYSVGKYWRFISNITSGYTEYSCIGSAFTENVSGWTATDQFATGEYVGNVGIDSEPTAGSSNLVESGGVYEKIEGKPNYKSDVHLNNLGQEITDVDSCVTDFIPLDVSSLTSGIRVYYGVYSAGSAIGCYNSNKEFINYFSQQPDSDSRSFSQEQLESIDGLAYIRVSFAKGYECKVQDINTNENLYVASILGGCVKKEDIIDTLESQDSEKVLSAKQGSVLNTRVTSLETVIDNKKTIPVYNSTDLITSGGVEASLYHQYGSKEITTSSVQAGIFLREFDYGECAAVRITNNTAVFADSNSIYLNVRHTDLTSKEVVMPLTNEWVVAIADDGKKIDRIYIRTSSNIQVTTAGIVNVEVIFKDAFFSLIKDVIPDLKSDRSLSSKGGFNILANYGVKNRVGKNLCNPALFKTDTILYNGAELPYSGYGVSGFIPVSTNGLVTSNIMLGRSSVYDSNLNFLRTISSLNYTYQEGDAYIKVCFSLSNKDRVQVEEGTVQTEFEPYNPIYGYEEDIKGEIMNRVDSLYVKSPVGPKDINFIHMYNLFNKDTGRDYEAGVTTVDIDDNIWYCYLYNNRLSGNNSYSVTAYMPIEGNQFFAHKLNGANIRWICYYTKDKVYISTETVSTSDSVFTPPQNAYYARITFYALEKNEFMVSLNTNPTEYVPYGKYSVDDIFIEEQEEPVEEIIPKIVMPSVVYALKGNENSIYHKNIIEYQHPLFYINTGGGIWNFFERYVRTDANSPGNLNIRLQSVVDLSVKQSIVIPTNIGDPSTDNGAKNVNVIGDSFTYGGTWFDQINNLCPNLKFVGMRKSSYTASTLRAEGRGGWRLSSYFLPYGDLTPTHMQPFSPFMHVDGYTYYGPIEFWKAIVTNTSQYVYGTAGFDDYISWFDNNGYKINPSVNDLMYDGTNDKYVYWNGSSWIDFNGTPTFEFNYSKYVQTWNIDSPDFVLIMLGVNDWFGQYSDELAQVWNQQMNIFIDSVHQYAQSVNKSIVIGICTNTTIIGTPSNSYHSNIKQSSRYEFLGRKNTINTFDNDTYKNQGVYVVDTGACLDSDYGFVIQKIKPFVYYEGDERENYDNNGVHPSTAGYKQLGTCAAGFIQYMRA